MNYLNQYLCDGANYQARAVLAFLQWRDIYSDSEDTNKPRPTVARWENCREQGYVVCLKSKRYDRQLNIAFFEHRNSDEICAIEWEQVTINSPTIDTAAFGKVYADKWDVSHRTHYAEVRQMADWIFARMETFWKETENPKDTGKSTKGKQP